MEEENKMEEQIKENEENNSQEQIDKKEETNNQLLAANSQLEDRLKRVMAEFENYKKRTVKEREFLYDSITADIITGFLPVLDSIEKAIEADSEDEQLKQGLDLISRQILDVMKLHKVEIIPTVGETFDPELHEAVSHVEDEKYGEKKVISEFRRGYKVGMKVIRHAMVTVAN